MNLKKILSNLFSVKTVESTFLSNDLSLTIDLNWISHKNDGKNLRQDYLKTKKDLNHALKEYKNFK